MPNKSFLAAAIGAAAGSPKRRIAPRPLPQPSRQALLKRQQRKSKRARELRERAMNATGVATSPLSSISELLRPFTYRDLAKMTGLSESGITFIMTGRREPTFTNGLRVARALGVHPEKMWVYLKQRRAEMKIKTARRRALKAATSNLKSVATRRTPA